VGQAGRRLTRERPCRMETEPLVFANEIILAAYPAPTVCIALPETSPGLCSQVRNGLKDFDEFFRKLWETQENNFKNAIIFYCIFYF
jgi:hypothetical protein